ncbi:MAG: hypothetical protein ABEJ71_00505 [Halodesulfurarchaeum sp.]
MSGRTHGWIGVRGMQALIVTITAYGLLIRNVSILVNGVLGLTTTFLPGVLARDHELVLDRDLVRWITLAILLHTIGMAGPYETVWWWDHLRHTLSAGLVAIVGYAVTRAIDVHRDSIYLPPDFRYVFVIVFTLAAGVLWEVMEFVARAVAMWLGHRAILVQYGVGDSVLDLVFDLVGGVLVAFFGGGPADRLASSLDRLFDRVPGSREFGR